MKENKLTHALSFPRIKQTLGCRAYRCFFHDLNFINVTFARRVRVFSAVMALILQVRHD